MSHTDLQNRPDTELVPRVMARAMFALVLTVLALVTWATLTERPLESTPPPGEILAQRQILLEGNISGAATVRDLNGAVLVDLGPEEGGFISGVWRVVIRERTKHGVGLEGPLTLIRRDTGRISILDPSTGWSADLMGFGIDNARAFARLLAL
ncbi:MAG: photosynthetic complex assembly protein PuhC [Arenibacterium sp.]